MRYPAKVTLILSLVALLSFSGCNKLRARDELNKGVRAYKGAQFEACVEHFQRAIELDPDLLIARIYLATAYASQFVPGSPTEENRQMGEAAIREFEKVLEKDPDNTTALGYIASMYYGIGGAQTLEEMQVLFEKSKEFRQRLIDVEPANPEHYYSIAVVDWTLAYRRNQELRASLGRRPDEPLPRRAVQQLAEENGALVEEGIEMLKKALEINPQYLEALAYLNLMYRQKADIVDTPQEREQYLQMADDLVERHRRLREQLEAGTTAAAD